MTNDVKILKYKFHSIIGITDDDETDPLEHSRLILQQHVTPLHIYKDTSKTFHAKPEHFEPLSISIPNNEPELRFDVQLAQKLSSPSSSYGTVCVPDSGFRDSKSMSKGFVSPEVANRNQRSSGELAKSDPFKGNFRFHSYLIEKCFR